MTRAFIFFVVIANNLHGRWTLCTGVWRNQVQDLSQRSWNTTTQTVWRPDKRNSSGCLAVTQLHIQCVVCENNKERLLRKIFFAKIYQKIFASAQSAHLSGFAGATIWWDRVMILFVVSRPISLLATFSLWMSTVWSIKKKLLQKQKDITAILFKSEVVFGGFENKS